MHAREKSSAWTASAIIRRIAIPLAIDFTQVSSLLTQQPDLRAGCHSLATSVLRRVCSRLVQPASVQSDSSVLRSGTLLPSLRWFKHILVHRFSLVELGSDRLRVVPPHLGPRRRWRGKCIYVRGAPNRSSLTGLQFFGVPSGHSVVAAAFQRLKSEH